MIFRWRPSADYLAKWFAASVAVFFLLGAALVAYVCLWYFPQPTLVLAPDFTLQDQDGRSHHLADYGGRPVVLMFYSGVDAESELGLRALRDVVHQFELQGIKVFAISERATAQQKPFRDAEKIPFPLLFDTDGRVATRYRIGSLKGPGGRAAFVIGRRGTIMQSVRQLQMPRLGEQLLMLAQCCLDPRKQLHVRAMGKPVADFQLPQVTDGKAVSLYEGARARATVIFITSSECPCSRAYDGRLCAIARDYQPQGVRFLALNASAGETPSEIAAHAQSAGYPFPVLKDDRNRIADRLEAQVTPEVFVIDAARTLRYHGRIDDSRQPESVRANDLRNALDVLLAGKLPPKPELNSFGCAIARVPHTSASAPL